MEAHHIIPWELLEHDLIQKAALDGFHPNMLENGIGLKKYSKLLGNGLHGNHPAYKKYIESKIIEQFPDWHTATPQQANKYLQEALIPELKSLIIKAEQSGLNLNEYFKSVNNEIF